MIDRSLFTVILEWAKKTEQIEIGLKLNNLFLSIPTEEFEKQIPMQNMTMDAYTSGNFNPPVFFPLYSLTPMPYEPQ